MKLANRALALLLGILMVLSAMPAFANTATAAFSDFPYGSWSEEAMTAAVENGLLKGKGNGTVAPKDYLTRAEAAAIINRAFGATVKADISAFTDVDKNSWYYDEIAKAVNMQTIVGVSSTKADPTGYITRESMLAVIARALVLDDGSQADLSKFTDGGSVSGWAKGQVAAMAKRGYVNGNEKGQLMPQSYITREEFAQIMHNIFKVYIPDDVIINGGSYGTTVIRAKDVSLNHVIINGDLVVGDGVGTGNLNLTNVTVKGRILFRGGEGKVKLTNTIVGEKVVINDVNGIVNFLNYRADEPFKNLQENTEAKFLNLIVNSGGGSSTPSRVEYKVREYVQNIDGTYPSSAKYSDEKMADYGKTIEYQARDIIGFTFDSTHPDSVLSGSNKGKLVLKAYYTRNKYKVSFEGYETEIPYEAKINTDSDLKAKMQNIVNKNTESGYNTEFNTKEDGTGKKVTIDDTTVGAENLPIYAIKTPIEYKINYKLNGGKIEGQYDKTFNVEDADVILPTNVVKTGYTFTGWTDENGNPCEKIPAGSKGDKTYTANWEIVNYTITYVTGENGTMDGVVAKTTYTVEDGKYTLPAPTVTKKDYVFKGWYENADFSGRAVTVLNPADAVNKTYYAKIVERTYEQYTIIYNGKEYTVTEGDAIGDAVDSKGNKLGDAMDNTTYPKGYESDDFRIKGDEYTVITKDSIAIGNMEIEAAKKPIVYTITYNVNGGSLDGTQKITYTVEDADYTLPIPAKTDYIFDGWYEKSDFSGIAVTVLDTADAENKIYYAKWSKVKYSVEFDGKTYMVEKGGKLGDATDAKGNKLGDAMDNVTYPKGYEADGFYKNNNPADKVTKDTVVDGNMEIKAGKKAIVYTITYNLDGGSFASAPKASYTVEDADYTLPTPTKGDYTFLGWYENGTKVTKLDTADAENKTYVASWRAPAAVVYTITFEGTGYSVHKGNALYTNEDLKDAMDEAANNASKGYEVSFNTKADGTGDDVTINTVASGNMTVYVIETAIVYNITYEENGGNTVADDTYTVEDADITLPVPAKTGYVFRGWYEEADFSGNAVTVLDTADAEDKIFYAKWIKDDAKLYFEHEVNGDTITVKVMLSSIPADIDEIAAMTIRYAYDSAKLEYVGTDSEVGDVAASAGNISWYSNNAFIDADTLDATDKVLFVITFNKAADAQGTTEVSYKFAEITASKPAGNPVVTTRYTKESETIDLGAHVSTYTIKYVTNGGDAIADGSYTANDADITLPIPVRAGYVFKGWYEEADFSGNAVTVLDTADAEDKTYYAKWVKDDAGLYFEHEVNGDTITVKAMLSAIPADIDEIAAMTIRYAYDSTKLEYVGTDSEVGDVAASAGNISWFSNAAFIDADTLDATDNVLFVITFNKVANAYGTTEVSYKFAEITASKPAGNPVVTTRYTKESEIIDLGTQIITYTIKYVTNGGDAIADGSYTANDADITLPIPVRAGYVFKGWYEEADFSGNAVTVLDTADAEDKIYYAKWVVETATIGFSSEIIGNTVKIYVTLDEIPSDINEIAALTLKYKHPENKLTFVSGSTTFGGNFSAKDGYISWYNNTSAITSESLKANGNILATLEFSKTDAANGIETFEYTFVEVVSEKPVNNPVIATKYTTEKEEVQLNAAVYSVSFNGESYNITAGNALSSNALLVAAMNDAADKAGYDVTFNTKADGTGTPVTADTIPTGNMTFYAVETATEYTITYNLGGIGALPANAKTTYKVNELPYTLPVLSDTANYTFEGWKDANGNVATAIAEGTTGNLTFTAIWEEIIIPEAEYTITYVLGGIGTLPANAKTTYKASELPYTLPVLSDTANYTFEGWKDANGNVVTAIAEGTTGNLTFTAIWEEIVIPETEYTITYVLGEIGTLPADAKTTYKTSELPYTLPVLADTADYTFAGWRNASGVIVTEIAAGTTGNLTFTAIWEEIIIPEAEYTITYVLDGVGELPADAKTTYKTSELPYTLPVLEHTATHTFKGWKDANGNVVTAIAEGTTGNLTFTAIWEEIPEDAYTITYVTNGGSLDGTQKTSYTASQLPYTLPIPSKNGAPFVGWYETEDFSGEVVTAIAAGTTGDKVYYAKWQQYTVQFYLGTKMTRNKPNSDDGDKGKMVVDYGAALTQADVDRELGMDPSEYNTAEGYTDSDGQVHKIYPELWYVKNGEYTKFIPEEVVVTSDMDIFLFVRYMEFSYETDLEIKGIDMEKIGKITLTVPYDSKTDIGKSYFDALTNAGETTRRILDAIEDQGYDLYQMAIDKAASTGLVDSDGNILNPPVAIPLHKFITEERIMSEINKYIDDNIDNEEFIADLLRNDFVVDMLLNDEDLKHSAMGNPEIREMFLTDDFVKEMIRLHPEFVDIIIDHDEFVELIINNDATFDYVLEDDTMVAKILDNASFKNKIIEKGTDYIVDNYFGTSGDPEVKDYITKQLKSEDVKAQLKDIIYSDPSVKQTLKETLISDEDAKDILKDKIRGMLDDPATEADIRGEVRSYLLSNSVVLRADIKDYISENSASLRDDIKAYIGNNSASLRADIKAYIGNNSASLRDDIKAYIGNNSASLRADIKAYIGNNSADLRDDIKAYIGGNSASLRADIKAYIGNNSADLRDDIKSYIGGNSADLRDDIKSYIETQKDSIKSDVISYIEANSDDFKAEDKRAEILDETANPEIWNTFKAEFETLKLTYPALNAFTFEEFVADFLSGVLAADHPTEYVDVVNSYNKAIDDNLTTYVTNNYDDLFVDYFDDYYSGLSNSEYQDLFDDNFSGYYDGLTDAEYQDLFDDNFSGYYDGLTDTEYQDLFDDNFSGYYDSLTNAEYQDLFDDNFSGYYDGLTDAEYQDLFDDNFSGYYDGLTDAEYQDLFDDNFSGYYDGLTDAEYQDLFDDNFSGYYDGLTDAEYQDLFDDNFSGYYDGLTDAEYQDLFNDNFAGYFDGLTSQEFKDLFNSKFEDFFEKQYSDLFDEYFDDYFDTMFDSLYESNVEKWAKMAYDEPATKATVTDTIEDVICDLIDSYISGTADQELKDFINKIVEDFDVKGYVRDNYYTDADLKSTIDSLVKDNARDIIDDYANNKASAEIVTLIDDNMHKYIEEIVDDYVNYTLDAELMAFIDEEINKYMLDYINKYITGEDRELLSKLVPTYAHDAVEAIKETDSFKNTISDFASGNGVRVNEGNIMFIEILDELMHTYDYDKLANDFLPATAKQIVDLVGHDMVAGIVNDYFAAFCADMDEAVANLNADRDAGIEGTEYKFSTSPSVRINFMKIIHSYYAKLTGKLRDKINSQSKIPVSSNPYAQRIVDFDYFSLYFDEGAPADEYKSGFKLKDDVMDYYNIRLQYAILMHDAVTFYGRRSEYTLEEKLDSASLLIGTYANKANDVIMNFIENGELPKGYTLEDILNINGTIESLYNKFKDKIEKGEDLYAEYLDKDYTDVIDLANMSIYANGNEHKIYQIILENGEDAFDLDDLITAIFDSPKYIGVSQIENAMAKVESKIKNYAYVPENNIYVYTVDAYKGTFESKSIKGYETGTHTIALQRYLRYYK